MKNFISTIVALITFVPTILYYLPYSLFWGVCVAPQNLWDASKTLPLYKRVAHLAWAWPTAIVLSPVGVPIMIDLFRGWAEDKAYRRALREAQA